MRNVSAHEARVEGFWHRWLDRHVPLTGPDLSRLDIMDGASPGPTSHRRQHPQQSVPV